MTREDIIRMAREVGCEIPSGPEGVEFFFYPHELERFAALVAAAERERVMDEWFTRMQADLEHGVKWLNENAAETWRNNYPQMAGFADAVMERSKE